MQIYYTGIPTVTYEIRKLQSGERKSALTSTLYCRLWMYTESTERDLAPPREPQEVIENATIAIRMNKGI